jgi:hypothetical protein
VDPPLAGRRVVDERDDQDPVPTPRIGWRGSSVPNTSSSASAPGSPSTEAISERIGLSVRNVRTLRAAASVTASLDEPIGETGTTLGESIADDHAVDPWRQIDERESHRRVWSMVGLLPDRHREVLLRRYGLRARSPRHTPRSARASASARSAAASWSARRAPAQVAGGSE